jgi:diguanylate cyclase (GGDEF)-like protein
MTSPTLSRDPTLLGRLLLFRNVDPESIEVYLERCHDLSLDAGEVLIRPDKINEHVYLLVSGRLNVHLDSLDSPPLNFLEPGECAGELSIIDSGYPSAYVSTAEPSELIALPHDTLWALVDASHAVARNLLYVVSRRVRHGSAVISRNSQALREFERNSTIDPLTELHNRRWMEDMFGRELQRCATSNMPLSLIVLDVDNFKRYNDEYGHLVGDRILQAVADTLRQHIRATEMAVRFGGDEVALMLPDRAAADAHQVAERIRQAVETIVLPNPQGGSLPNPTVSLGYAQSEPGDTLEALLARADAALYRAKKGGRNRVSD